MSSNLPVHFFIPLLAVCVVITLLGGAGCRAFENTHVSPINPDFVAAKTAEVISYGTLLLSGFGLTLLATIVRIFNGWKGAFLLVAVGAPASLCGLLYPAYPKIVYYVPAVLAGGVLCYVIRRVIQRITAWHEGWKAFQAMLTLAKQTDAGAPELLNKVKTQLEKSCTTNQSTVNPLKPPLINSLPNTTKPTSPPTGPDL